MIIEQFYDKGLAHGSYMIISGHEAVVIDPARDPEPYYRFARAHDAKITAVIETHPHADFVSGHLEIANSTGATIYVSKLLGASYPHQTFDEGDTIYVGRLQLKALNTPGHSPDSISVLLYDEEGKEHALFSGDTLFVGDVGRPDLRESVGNLTAKRDELARNMYNTVKEKLSALHDEVLVYPAHGAGSLCGKNLNSDLYSTIGRERRENFAFKAATEDQFVQELLQDQPFIPKYFGYDVNLNRNGAPSYADSILSVPRLPSDTKPEPGVLIIDARNEAEFKKGHFPGSINLQDGGKFETWLGSIVGPEEAFYLVADSQEVLDSLIRKAAKIGYERFIKGAFTVPANLPKQSALLDMNHFKANPSEYTILDVRNRGEMAERKIFPGALEIPLPELRERIAEIKSDKPVLVHCAAGYRSAAAMSILEPALNVPVYDLGETIKAF